MSTMVRFWRDERAATAIEYCMIAGGIALAIVLGVTQVGIKISKFYGNVSSGLN